MEANWAIIPNFNRLEESLDLAKEYGASFEYDDFFDPSVYEDESECERRIKAYTLLGRDTSRDTLHGVFYDIVANSKDSVISNRSIELMDKSMQIADRLGCKGVVFHTGIVAGLNTEGYINGWVEDMSEILPKLVHNYPNLTIYIENTFEKDYRPLTKLMKKCEQNKNIKICLDYAHAVLTPTPVEEWVLNLSECTHHVHINDNDLVADLHEVPGEGEIDFKKFKTLIKPICEANDCNILLELTGIDRQRAALEYMRGL